MILVSSPYSENGKFRNLSILITKAVLCAIHKCQCIQQKEVRSELAVLLSLTAVGAVPSLSQGKHCVVCFGSSAYLSEVP